MMRSSGAIWSRSSPKEGLSQVVISACAETRDFLAELTDRDANVFQANVCDNRRRCSGVKKDSNSASGAEITRVGRAITGFYYGFLFLSFDCFYLPFYAVWVYKVRGSTICIARIEWITR